MSGNECPIAPLARLIAAREPAAIRGIGFEIESNVPALNGKTGGITAYIPSPDMAQRPAANLPNWWTDDPCPDVAEGSHGGAKTVSRWREAFLGDFAQRMLRCQSPASTQTLNEKRITDG